MAKKKTKRKVQRPVSGNAFILQRIVGIVLLCFIVVVLGFIGASFLKGEDNKPARAAKSAQTSGKTAAAGSAAVKTAPAAAEPKPKYTFYDDLTKRSQEVQAELKERIAQDNSVKVQGRNYRVQVGAFKDKDKADQLRARMILRDYPVQIINNGDVYLVQVGPYTDRGQAVQMEKKIKREGLKDTVLKAYVN